MRARAEELLRLWIALFDVVEDPKAFRNAQDQFNRIYKRSDYQQQGLYHKLVSEWMKEEV